ncbi:4'-phosphopantetheinyl transferase family protein [Paenibacillus popilliae]|nr:4'-phosphopantetheinyl transferase superfamily protein [Paenibacillus sp. SDF0028]
MNPYIGEIIVVDSDSALYKCSVCFCNYSYIVGHCEAKSFLHVEELEYFNKLKFENRIKSYLIGRYAAKRAFLHQTSENSLQHVYIKSGVFGQPVFGSPFTHNLQLSITHSGDMGGAIVFPESCPMGIDIECISNVSRSGFISQITNSEKSLVFNSQSENRMNESGVLAIIWSAKESLSKVLKTGLTVPFEVLEISDITNVGDYYICYYKNFIQYYTLSTCKDDYLLSITYPKNLKLQNIEHVIKGFHESVESVR